MISHRFFVPGFLLVVVFVLSDVSAIYAQTHRPYDDITIRENGSNIVVRVAPSLAQGGCMTLYTANDNCSAHKTSTGNPFEHFHVHYTFPIEGTVVSNGTTKEINETNVRAYWDWWFGIEAGNRENVESFGNDGGENATYNCWGYSLGYSTWVENPTPIYNDDYVSTSSPSEGDVIKLAGHVISITSINHCESPSLVIGTSEKNQYSGIYHFLYEYSGGLGDDSYKNYYTPKP